MKTKNVILFVAIPVSFQLLFIGLCFSGNPYARELITPNLGREFGIVEQLQNICLLAIIVIFAIAVLRRPSIPERSFFLVGFLLTLFVLLEEIDYGLNFYEVFTGQPAGVEIRNWHNLETSSGKENVRYLKRVIDAVNAVWFFILPMLANKVTYLPLKRIIPSRWFILLFALSILLSRIAHLFEETVGGGGNMCYLESNLSEFRETTTYYLYLLYALQLFKTRFRPAAVEPRVKEA